MTDDKILLRKEFEFARYRLRSAFLTPIVALGMFSIPSVIANVLLLLINLRNLHGERKFKLVNPISIAMSFLGLVMVILSFVWPAVYDIVFFPTILLLTLFVVAFGLALCGQPFTDFLGTSLGDRRRHWYTSLSWAAIYLLCALISWYIPSYDEIYFIPILFIAIGSAFTLWLQLFYDPTKGEDVGKDRLVQPFFCNKETIREVFTFCTQALL